MKRTSRFVGTVSECGKSGSHIRKASRKSSQSRELNIRISKRAEVVLRYQNRTMTVVHQAPGEPHMASFGSRVVPREFYSRLCMETRVLFMESNMETPTSEFVKQLRALVNNLIDALNNGDAASIQRNQQAFSDVIEYAWQYFNRPDIPAKEKAIPRLIESWTQRDLMTEISNPDNHQQAIHDLKLFENSLVLFE